MKITTRDFIGFSIGFIIGMLVASNIFIWGNLLI